MTPAFRRNGIIAGLALSALCALGFAQRSSNEWAIRWEAESEVREAREAELVTAQRDRGTEMDAMQRRVALLESELAREREGRESAERRATAAARPPAELEASRAELERAYGRIGELERGDGIVRFGKPVSDLQIGLVIEEEDSIKTVECANARIRALISERPCKFLEAVEPLSQKDEGGLNQGLDYVDPAETWGEPQSLGEGLNQGVIYGDRDLVPEVKTVKYKLEKVRELIGKLKETQCEQETLTVEHK